MIFKLFSRKSHDATAERLYGEIMAAARRPALFLPPYAAPDTLEGRFDMLVLHAFLVIRRLAASPAPAPELAQDLSNHLFAALDRALREMGVGDLAVPKRIARLASDYNGRRTAYEAALGEGEDALAAALARNVYGSADAGVGAPLARYVLKAEAALAAAPFAAFENGPAPFPAPEEKP
ncbi:MAG TPA: ubiquinol-cytochrome C chaperone family protein [Rhodoblastus sp.]|nr:ubiquinol-cytochrome C chaperone family protein [Rhodoblastus sp.]